MPESETEKKPRLFVYGRCSNETWLLCGGPDIEEAVTGLINHLHAEVVELMNSDPGEPVEISFEMRMMTDEEIKQLPIV